MPGADYWILDTDYDKYALVHSCSDFFGLFHTEVDYLLSGYRQLDQGTIDMAFQKFEEQGVDLAPFVFTNQDGC